MDNQLAFIFPEASVIYVGCLPIRVRQVICNILDPEASVGCRDYRLFGELVGLTPVEIRALRANTNGRSVTEAILSEVQNRVTIWKLICVLREMQVGGISEILQCWQDIQAFHYREMATYGGIQNTEEGCRCQNCQTVYSQMETTYPSSQQLDCSPKVHRNMRRERGSSYVRDVPRNIGGRSSPVEGRQGSNLQEVPAINSRRKVVMETVQQTPLLNRELSNEENCSSLPSSTEQDHVEEQIGDLEEAIHYENFFPPEDFTSLTDDECQNRGGDILQDHRSLTASTSPNSESVARSPEGNLLDRPSHNAGFYPYNQRPEFNNQRLNQSNFNGYGPHGMPGQAFPETDHDLNQQTLRKMAFSTTEVQQQRYMQQNREHQRQVNGNYYASFPADQMWRNEELHGYGCQEQPACPQLQRGMSNLFQGQNAPTREMLRPSNPPEEMPMQERCTKMREDGVRRKENSRDKEKRHSDPSPTSSSEYIHQMSGNKQMPRGATGTGSVERTGRQNVSPETLHRRSSSSEEVIYRKNSDEETADGAPSRYVFITGGETTNGDQVQEEIWKMCKDLHRKNIPVVADLPRGLIAMPGDPLAVRHNLRQSINESTSEYFKKATCVVLAVSPGYADYVNRHNSPLSPTSHHLSARFIYTQMMSEYCNKNFSRNKRFYPVILHRVDGQREHIPDWLRSTFIYSYPASNSELVRHLKDDLGF